MAEHLSEADTAPKANIRRRVGVGAAIVAMLAVIMYGTGVWWFGSHFVPGTTVNNMDVSWMDADDLATMVESQTAAYANHVTGNGVDLVITAQDIDLSIDGTTFAQTAMAQTNPYTWPLDALRPRTFDTPDDNVSFSHDKLASLVEATAAAVNESAVPPTNASATWNGEQGSFVVVEPVEGTMVDAGATTDALAGDVADLSTATILGTEELVRPAITADNAELAAAIDRANAMAALTIALVKGGTEMATVSRAEIGSWVQVTPELTCIIDRDAVVGWVAGTLTEKVATSDEVYTWAIDAEATADTIVGAIDGLSSEPVEIAMTVVDERPPESEGARSRGRHVDVNLSNQYARLYDTDGRVLWRSYIVSGNTSTGHGTITGTFAIQGKEREKVLIGLDEDNDGKPDYETPVHYWMPFSGGYGLHDADWRYYFGGSIYSWNGSHGCVNLPVDAAAELYGLINVGDTVIVHW